MLRKIIISLAVCLPLAACETLSGGGGSDKYSPAALKQNLKPGVTTPAEVRKIYGTPDYTSEDSNGPSLWAYNVDADTNSAIRSAANMLPYVSGLYATADSMTKGRNLSVHFSNNRVSNYSLSDSKPR